MEKNKGRVHLVGAGCGKAELISLNGKRLIENADVIIYDELIDFSLMGFAKINAEKISVGKRGGKRSAPQSDINALLIEKAKEGKDVVRLKGGDPFVFGRGGEEIQALTAEGIEYEEVPGISSAIAIPAEAGIPVTHRNLSRSFHVITAHSSDSVDSLPSDLDKLATLEGTLVFLMGLKSLKSLSERLIKFGKSPNTPAAVISGGNAVKRTVRGKLSDIAEKAIAAEFLPPAVIVVGEVAALDFSSTISLPLSGVKVGLTGTDSIQNKLKTSLEALGAETICAERSECIPIDISAEIEKLRDNTMRWIVLSSANGVDIFFDAFKKERVDFRCLASCKFAVIGAATGKRLSEYGIYPDLVPKSFTSKGLAEELCKTVHNDTEILLFRAENASSVLTDILSEAKLNFTDIPTYRLSPDLSASVSDDALKGINYLVFSSAGGVKLYRDIHGRIPEGTVCVSIGKTCTAAVKECFDPKVIEASEITAEGIVKAICADKSI